MHWDFRLEVDGLLKSWPLRKPPSLDPKQKRGATMVEDHPYDYRTFEGVIPKGEYGGGQVIVWDEGIYTPDEDGTTSWDDKEAGSRRMLEGLARGKLSFTMSGSKLKGSFALIKTSYSPTSWLLIKHKDEHVSDREMLDDDKSVRSGLTVQDLKDGRLPGPATPAKAEVRAMPSGAREASMPAPSSLRPMLATLVDKPFDAQGWIWEPKLDGIRTLSFIKDGKVELRSRRGVDVTKGYPDLVKALAQQPAASMLLDGEICVLDENGAPRFQLIQPRINLTRPADIQQMEAEIPVVYFVFDLLYLDGHDLRSVPLRERRALIESRLATGGPVRLVTQVPEDGESLAEAARQMGFEGVMGKRADSRYDPGGRSKAWVKVKTVQEQEFVVGGYTRGEGARRSSFGALAIGYFGDEHADSNKKLRYAGNVGSGFNDKELGQVLARLRELERKDSPFDGPVEGKVNWVEPKLIAEIKFSEWTQDGRLRAPVFQGFREDIAPEEVRKEEPESVEEIDADAGTSNDKNSITTPGPSGRGTSTQTSSRTDGDTPRAALTDSGKAQRPTIPPGPAKAEPHISVAELLGQVSEKIAEHDPETWPVLRQLENPKANFVAKVAGADVKLSNLDKVFWPAYGDVPPLTKRDLIRFYVEVAPVLLPHLRDRPLTLTRYPNGISGSLFYQKHYGQPIPDFVETVDIFSSHNDEDGKYILCNNLPTLVWLAQIADLELHAWMSRVNPEPDAVGTTLTFDGSEAALDASVLNYPDYMIFDLDPYIYSGKEAKGAEPEFNQRGWEKTVEIALALKELLDQMRLSSYVKTTGKTGIHVYVPILRHYDYDEVRAATATIGRFMIQQHPKDITMEWDTSKRTGKVFFDHNQNTRGKTLAAQYSLRPTPWAGVSTPVTWTELPRIEPATLNLSTVPRRVVELGDLWLDSLQRKNDLGVLLGA